MTWPTAPGRSEVGSQDESTTSHRAHQALLRPTTAPSSLSHLTVCSHCTYYDHQPVHHAVQLGFLPLDLPTVPHNFGIKSCARNILEVKTSPQSPEGHLAAKRCCFPP